LIHLLPYENRVSYTTLVANASNRKSEYARRFSDNNKYVDLLEKRFFSEIIYEFAS
jgi:hypothetical protein